MKSKINRRNFLQGSGVLLCLPWMETLSAKEISKEKIRRFVSIYQPHGVGMPLKKDPAFKDWSWFPRGEGKDFTFTKVLEPLEKLRNDVTIYSGLSHPASREVHGHSTADQYLTGADTGSEGLYKNSISLDQVIANKFGDYTRYSSLVLSTAGGVGAPRGATTSSFNFKGRPIPAMNRPKQIFDALFLAKDANSKAKLSRTKSVLDLFLESRDDYRRQVSKQDSTTLDNYLDSVRDTEKKVIKAQKWVSTPLDKVDKNNFNLDVTPRDAKNYLRTMYSLMYHALVTDSTRVITYMIGQENSIGKIDDLLSLAIGIKGAHGLTHAVKKPGGWKNLGTYNNFQVNELAIFINKLKNTRELNGQGNMLDNTFVMHGSASSSFHLSRNYPIISAGGKDLGFKNGRFLNFSKDKELQAFAGISSDIGWRSKDDGSEKPLAHLFVTILNRMGIEQDTFANYKGTLKGV